MLTLFLTFLKIGAVSFGGGYGMISLLKEEVILHGWLTEGELLNLIAVSESTPGPIAINMATFVGAKFGILGSVLATLGVVLPSFFIILLIASVFNKLLKYKVVSSFLDGVKPVVLGLIIGTGLLFILSSILSLSTISNGISFDYRALIIFVIIFLIWLFYKLRFKKNISVILLIIISAFLGIVFYGFLGAI